MKRRLPSLTLALLLNLACSPAARALCVAPVCTVTVTTTNVAFGNYSPLLYTNTTTTGSITITFGGVAGLLIPFNIAISAGSSASFSTRRLRSGSNTLNYNLYLDPSYTTIWGDGTGGSQVVNGSVTLDLLGLSPGQVFYVYGSIPARQLTAVPGVYNDVITVTLTYY